MNVSMHRLLRWTVACTRLNAPQFQVNILVADMMRVDVPFGACPQCSGEVTRPSAFPSQSTPFDFCLQHVSWVDWRIGTWRKEADNRRLAMI